MSTPEQKPEKPLYQLLSHTLVDIYVGPESTHWILHEKLLCHHSPFFASIFYNKSKKESSSKAFGLPDVDDGPFELFVGWLYSRALRYPDSESDIGPLLELYLLSERLEIEALASDVVETVRAWYHNNEAYPELRRLQYIYANTEEDNQMREMMVGAVARQLTLADKIPAHWEKALRKNGQLAVDIIRSIQEWHLESRSVPDPRDVDMERERGRGDDGKLGFSAIEGTSQASTMEGEGYEMVNGNGNGSKGGSED